MKDLKLSFPYPSTSRHNLSQSVATSMSMGLVTPIRVVEVLPGDTHRIATKFSAISNPLVKPLLQGIRLRYCRFWIPRRIYHYNQRANNSDFDPQTAPVRHGQHVGLRFPGAFSDGLVRQYSNFGQSSLFDYLHMAPVESNLITPENASQLPDVPVRLAPLSGSVYDITFFNAEPYLAYLDVCRNYFADSANDMIAFAWGYFGSNVTSVSPRVAISSLSLLDGYFDSVQNNSSQIPAFDLTTKSYIASSPAKFGAFILPDRDSFLHLKPQPVGADFDRFLRSPRFGLCVPLSRPDRFSRLFDTKPLTSQNATITPSEISIGNLSFLSKLQRYLTRRFFGGSRFTDVMYSVFGQRVPHVDSPVLLDVFDYELGSESVASTNSSDTKSLGVLGGFISASGRLTTSRGHYRRKYVFNESGYLLDVCYILPRLYRTAYYPDFYPLISGASGTVDVHMAQGNFIPDFNGIGWQQPSFVSSFKNVEFNTSSTGVTTTAVSPVVGFCCEPSWQQYRTLPDICTGAMNPLRYVPGVQDPATGVGVIPSTYTLNSPLFTFNDRMIPYNFSYGFKQDSSSETDYSNLARLLLARTSFSDFNQLNQVFGVNTLTVDNIFLVFDYAHQSKRQVTKRFTLNFN